MSGCWMDGWTLTASPPMKRVVLAKTRHSPTVDYRVRDPHTTQTAWITEHSHHDPSQSWRPGLGIGPLLVPQVREQEGAPHVDDAAGEAGRQDGEHDITGLTRDDRGAKAPSKFRPITPVDVVRY